MTHGVKYLQEEDGEGAMVKREREKGKGGGRRERMGEVGERGERRKLVKDSSSTDILYDPRCR